MHKPLTEEQIRLWLREYKWEIRKCDTLDVSTAFIDILNSYISLNCNDLRQFFPFRTTTYRADATILEDCWSFVARYDTALQMPHLDIPPALRQKINSVVATTDWKNFTSGTLVPDYYRGLWDRETFCYIGSLKQMNASWGDFHLTMLNWVSLAVLPHILNENQMRIRRVIKPAPTWSADSFRDSVLVVEAGTNQGTCFYVQGIGYLTSAHTLRRKDGTDYHREAEIYFSDDETGKQWAKVKQISELFDIALLESDLQPRRELQLSSADLIREMDHVLVCGHPNHNRGDSIMIHPGIVTGFRTLFGVRHISTNATIVAGASGSPVFKVDGRVIGMAQRGAKSVVDGQDTEAHLILPADVILSFINQTRSPQ